MLIDTHTHLFAEEFKNDIPYVIERALKNDVQKFFLPNIDSTSVEAMLSLEKMYPDHCYPMMGLHPCSIKENFKEELAIVDQWLEKRQFYGIGEVGLDFYWDKTFHVEQFDVLRHQIELSIKYKLPMIIHARNANTELIQTLNDYKSKNIFGIFHCFSDTYEVALKLLDLGNFKLGIGGIITYKNTTLKEVIGRVGVEHIVLETDSPYLAPVPFRGKRNESSFLIYIAQKVGEAFKLSVEQIAEITSNNANKIFKFE